MASSSGRWIFSGVAVRFGAERDALESTLDEICSSRLSSLPKPVASAIEYGLKSPGKRLRPLMVILAYRACDGRGDPTLLSCGPEIIHAYSLMHDDLPCMDDDDVRRGRATVHKVYGPRIAILAGAAMIPLATAVVRDGAAALGLDSRCESEVLRTLLVGAGAAGMIGGQVRDLAGEGASLPLEDLERIHLSKTAALISASLSIGGIAAGATAACMAALAQFGRDIGLAFQIMDDVLDVTSTTNELGKTTGRDAAMGKNSYPALLGVEGARSRAKALVEDGTEALARHNLLTPELSQVANFMLTRTS